jgi:hypothetical protein
VAPVRELSKDPIVRLLSALLRDAQAKRLRSIAVIYEMHNGDSNHQIAGDPPLDVEGMVLEIAHLIHAVIADEDARQAKAEAEAEAEA